MFSIAAVIPFSSAICFARAISIPSYSPITPFAVTYSKGGNSAFVPNVMVPPSAGAASSVSAAASSVSAAASSSAVSAVASVSAASVVASASADAVSALLPHATSVHAIIAIARISANTLVAFFIIVSSLILTGLFLSAGILLYYKPVIPSGNRHNTNLISGTL